MPYCLFVYVPAHLSSVAGSFLPEAAVGTDTTIHPHFSMVNPFLRIGAHKLSALVASLRSPPLPSPSLPFRSPHLDSTNLLPNSLKPTPPLGDQHGTINLARWDSGILGLAISTTSPDGDDSTSDIIREAMSFQLSFTYGHELERVLGISAILLGMTLIFLGVKLFKPLLFALSWFIFGGIIFFVTMLISHDSLASFLSGTIIGFILAVIIIRIWRLALFVVGGLLGFVLWIIFQSLFPNAISTTATKYVVLAVTSLVCGIIGMRMEKWALLISTPILGGFLFLQGLDSFLDAGLNAFVLLTKSGQHRCTSNGVACFGLYAALVTLAAIGMVLQYRWTAEMASASASSNKSPKKSSASSGPPEMIILSSPAKKKRKLKDDSSDTYRGVIASPTERSSFNPFSSPSSSSSSRRSAYSSVYSPTAPVWFEGTGP